MTINRSLKLFTSQPYIFLGLCNYNWIQYLSIYQFILLKSATKLLRHQCYRALPLTRNPSLKARNFDNSFARYFYSLFKTSERVLTVIISTSFDPCTSEHLLIRSRNLSKITHFLSCDIDSSKFLVSISFVDENLATKPFKS